MPPPVGGRGKSHKIIIKQRLVNTMDEREKSEESKPAAIDGGPYKL